jgi:hypothetical protein
VDCYFHSRVPSIAVCRDCAKPLCATCRDERGLCPSCRLDERIKSSSAARQRLGGSAGPANPSPPPYEPPPYEPPRRAPSTALATVTPEMRALLGLSYPLWPLALLSLLSPRRSPQIYRQAVQALALNFGCFGLYFGLGAIAHIPLLGLSALPLLAVLFPIWLVAAVVYGFRVWNGEDVRVPVIAEWLDERERPSTNSA